MKITILNGNAKEDNINFEDYLINLSSLLQSKGNEVHNLKLREMNIKYCTGCFGCWIKTPGRCVLNDECEKVYRGVINADFVLFASPIIMGFTSTILKKVNDRLVALLHPYFKIRNKTCRHIDRYDKRPIMGLLLDRNDNIDNDGLKIISDIYERIAMNFNTKFLLSKSLNNSIEEVANEISSI